MLLYLFDNLLCHYQKDSTVYFHKRIRGAVNLADHEKSLIKLQAAIKEIKELIF